MDPPYPPALLASCLVADEANAPAAADRVFSSASPGALPSLATPHHSRARPPRRIIPASRLSTSSNPPVNLIVKL
ncbi:hypothetical protein LX36DRAFT_656231 [Colletotrichum falcatum]|nr:hypothetical protein LX36DRAFT_656231 [Colletotrichum falcatum]